MEREDAATHGSAMRKFCSDIRGIAAVEFSLIALFLSLTCLTVIDIGNYVYQRMEVENAARMGAQWAWKACPPGSQPATVNCPGLTAAVTSGIQSTSLGKAVTLVVSPPTEGYYCATSGNTLKPQGTLSSRPPDCTDTGYPGALPGDYIQVQVTAPYAPLFPGLSVMSTFAGTIGATSWIRLN